MTTIRIAAGDLAFTAHAEEQAAPRTLAAFRSMLPYAQSLLHVRWSGEACWIPMGAHDTGLDPENATSYPAPGHVLLYPGGISETEILIAYGPCRFASKAGQLAGNHFLTIREDLDALATLGRLTLQKGAQRIRFS